MRPVFTALVLAGLVSLAACADGPEAPARAVQDEAAYAMPPVVSAVARQGDGSLVVSGTATADERIRLVDLSGRTHGTTADAEGAFSLALPANETGDHLLSLTVQRAGRAVSSDGWLFAPRAAPQRAVMLRPGAASLPIGAAPLLAVVDHDGGGGVALSGRAEAGATVEIGLDGQPRGAVVAGPDDLWSTSLVLEGPTGSHLFTVASSGRRESVTIPLSASDPAQPVEVSILDGAIRVAWRLPGGGAQTTWIIPAD